MSVDVVYDCPLGSGVLLSQVTQSQFSENIDVLPGRMSGSGVISDQFIEGAAPHAQLTSMDIGGSLTIFGTTGSLLSGGNNVAIPYQKRASGGTFAGGSTNAVVKGAVSCPVLLMPMSVSAPPKGSPTFHGDLHFFSSDGLTQPYSIVTNQGLGSQAFNAMYGLGYIKVNGTLVPRQIGFTVHFGVGLSEKKHYDGAIWPTDIFQETFDPSIEFSQEDFDYISGIAGGASITTLYAWLRKRASGGTYASGVSTVHISFGFTSGFIRAQQISASETKNGQSSVQCLGRTLVVGNGVALI